MVRSRGFGVFVFVVCILATVQNFIVNSIGFLDAFTGSAFGCGHEWFQCNGRIIPVINSITTFIEFSHRVGVPILTILLLIAAVTSLMRYRKWREIPLFVSLSIFFVILEAVLGGLAVKYDEPPAVIATHFGVSLLAFVSVVLLTIYVRRAEHVYVEYCRDGRLLPLRGEPPLVWFRTFAWLGILVIYLAMYVGAYVSSSSAGDLFRGFPIPTERSGLPHHALLLDWAHRSIAGLLVLWMLTLVLWTGNMRESRPDLYRGAWFALSFVIAQAFSGAYLVLSHIGIIAFMFHVSIVTGLFVSVCYIAFQTVSPFRSTRV